MSYQQSSPDSERSPLFGAAPLVAEAVPERTPRNWRRFAAPLLVGAVVLAVIVGLVVGLGGESHEDSASLKKHQALIPAAVTDNSSIPPSHAADDHSSKHSSHHSKSSQHSKHDSSHSHSKSHKRGEDVAAVPSHAGGSSYRKHTNSSIINSNEDCDGPYPGYPYCEEHVLSLSRKWNSDPDTESYYRSRGIDGSKCSMLTYLNLNGFYCPEAADTNKQKIRGVNLGGWLVLEPWITPSLFEQFDVKHMIQDHWTFCEHLGKKEALRQLEKHWDTWVTKEDLKFLAESGINHIRIPFGHWMFGDILDSEPWVHGELPYLERAIRWAADLGLHVVLDLHAAPGSQNGFDNGGRKDVLEFGKEVKDEKGRITYPNIQRALGTIGNITKHFATPEWSGTVVGIELVNEAFVTIPIQVVKDYYLQGYEVVKKYSNTMAVIIGDSFRWGAWNDFMFPPHYRHVWIDTHIYQMFDSHRQSLTWQQHILQTCTVNRAEVSVAPLSTMVGEWSLATTDCARWLNGYNTGARFDGTFPGGQVPSGSCIGQDDLKNTTIWTPEYRQFLLEYASKQMDAYESGSSEGWFFWNFKTEKGSFQWNYILGVQEGWIPKDLDNRPYQC